MATEPIKVLAGILRIELGLKNDQVILYNQKFDIPPDERLYISIGLIGFKNFGSRNLHIGLADTDELTSQQGLNRQEVYSINVYSRGPDARTRNWEVVAALNSDTSQRWQETNSMRIATLPAAMSDVSEIEGTAILNRYALTVMALVSYQKTQSVPFFDTFETPPVLVTNP